jgi:alkanesulfonate monooxygenase SsuD/methylene tetrahydromethanopterin reductase-like flavin-dependent oxidoreductase (luciferase family)
VGDAADGFEVVLADLESTSETFATESVKVSDAVAGGSPQPVDTGSGVCTSALADALQAARLTTAQLAAVINAHSEKLHAAYQNYSSAEETNTVLCQKLVALS